MSILNINNLTEVESSALTDNDMLVLGTASGAKKIKANSLGGGGSDFSYDLNISATASAMGEHGELTISDCEVTSDKTIDDMISKIEDGQMLTVSGGIAYEDSGWDYLYSLGDVAMVGIIPGEALEELEITADGDAVLINVVSYAYIRSGGTVTTYVRSTFQLLLYEVSGELQYLDMGN